MKEIFKWKPSLITSVWMLSSVWAMNVNAEENQGEPQGPPLCQQDLTALLEQSSGAFSPALRAAFIAQGRAHVVQDLAKRGVTIDAKVMAWVDHDQVVSDAVYGTVYPADPDILINLNTLWLAQGEAFTKKYKQLSLAAAVARRGVGVGSLAHFSKWGSLYKTAVEAAKHGRDPVVALAKSKGKSAYLLPKTEADKLAYAAVAKYLKKNGLSHRQAFEDKEKLTEIGAILKKNHCGMKANHCLKGLLILHGERPEERTPTPTVAEYFKFLVKINETPASELPLEEGQRWPMFPVTTAPWPILMPLARTMPMDEANYIWEKFQGKHAGKRVHNYGPSRKGEKARNPTYDDRRWHWQAWPAVIKEGGVCGTMSTIAMGTYTTLGRPVLKAGQPGHSCLVTYNVTGDGKFIASLGQSVTAGPDGTGTSWLFQDGASWKCGGWGSNAVHHYGLALAMNPGLDTYMDTRMVLHIYRSLPADQQRTLGRKLLHDVLEKNPYNTEVWYTLAKDAGDVRTLVDLISSTKTLLQSSAEAELAKDGDASEAVQGAETEGVKVSRSTDKTLATYQKLVRAAIIQHAFANPSKFDRKNQVLALRYLEKTKGGGREVVLARDRFRAAISGPTSLMVSLQRELNKLLQKPPKGRENKRRIEGELKLRVNQVARLCDDRSQREKWLRSMMDTFPAGKAVQSKKGGDKKFTSIYNELFALLNKSYHAKPRNKSGQKQLGALKKKMLEG